MKIEKQNEIILPLLNCLVPLFMEEENSQIPLKMGDQNPWIVENIEAFNFYCCPECDFQSKDRDYFKRHAMESHKKSKVFFLMSKPEKNTNMEVETDPEYQDENEDGMDNFIASDTSVKEESISESEGIEIVRLSEHVLINKPEYKRQVQEDLEIFDEKSDFIEDNQKIFDDQGLEDNVEEAESFNEENYENVTDAETLEEKSIDGICPFHGIG